jgi:predicted Zn-dependent protease
MSKSSIFSYLEQKVLKRALKLGASEVEVLAYFTDDSVARFSKNLISESIAYNYTCAYIRILTSPGQYSEEFVGLPEGFDKGTYPELDSTLSRLISAAKSSGRKESIKSFNSKRSGETKSGVFSKKTAEVTDKERSEMSGSVIEKCLDYDPKIEQVAGTVATRTAFRFLANTNGLRLYHDYTGSSLVVTPLAKDGGSVGVGFASCNSNDIRDIDFDGLAEEASRDAVGSLHPKPIDLGSYDAIFAPDSAADVIDTFVQLGFWVGSSQSYVKLAEKCASELLTVVDDPRNPETLMSSTFDFEGFPTRKVVLIDRGIALNKCFDRRASFEANRNNQKRGKKIKSTGHSMLLFDGTYNTKFFSGWSYYPQNQIVKPGKSSVEEIIRDSKKAVLIKRLMYAGLPMGISSEDTVQAFSMGTWLVENGEVKYPTLSMRISDSLRKMVNNIDLMGNAKSTKRLGTANMPWVRCGNVQLADSASLAIPEGAF